MRLWLILGATVGFSSCATMTLPGEGRAVGDREAAKRVLEDSAVKTKTPWRKYRMAEVAYDGEWTAVARRLQPVLVDPEFRKRSVERYDTRRGTVEQTHTGPGGTKVVRRGGDRVEVIYNGARSSDREVKAAAALVADAYTAFLFGSGWLAANAGELVLLEDLPLEGDACRRVQGMLRPSFGFSESDRFIAWVGARDGLLKRLQFTIDGLESTRGADVVVDFSEHWQAADGSVWPGRFVERVVRPVPVKAHDWRMTGLSLDGRKMR